MQQQQQQYGYAPPAGYAPAGYAPAASYAPAAGYAPAGYAPPPAGYAPPPGGAPRRSLATRLKGSIANRPAMALAVIIVLAVVLTAALVYYRGVWFLGPFAHARTLRGGSRGKHAAGAASAATAAPAGASAIEFSNIGAQAAPPGGAPASDAEVDRLIDGIHSGR
jgi:hypothetical protein